jgi:hypothetical protein
LQIGDTADYKSALLLRHVSVFLKRKQINGRQDAGRVEHSETNEPGKLIVPRAFPHADAFHHAIADRNYDDNGNQRGEPHWGMMMGFHSKSEIVPAAK